MAYGHESGMRHTYDTLVSSAVPGFVFWVGHTIFFLIIHSRAVPKDGADF